jgi:hypothetical protein
MRVNRASHRVQPGVSAGETVPGQGRSLPEPPSRPHRRRRPQDASWAYIWSIDLFSRRFVSAVVLPLTFVVLLLAAVAAAVGLTYEAL